MTTENREPHVYVTYFEVGGNTRYRPLLHHWITEYDRVVSDGMRVSVLTDRDTDPESFSGMFYLDVDPSPFADVMRPGNHFDRKSAIIATALSSPMMDPGPCLIMDCDAIVHRDFTSALLDYLRAPLPISTPPDSGKRVIKARSGHVVHERSSSVLLFGRATQDERRQIAHDYRTCWHYLGQTEPDAGLATTIREQRAWTLVHHLWGTLNLPDVWNWSPYHWKPNPDAYIVHHHGQRKFADLT